MFRWRLRRLSYRLRDRGEASRLAKTSKMPVFFSHFKRRVTSCVFRLRGCRDEMFFALNFCVLSSGLPAAAKRRRRGKRMAFNKPHGRRGGSFLSTGIRVYYTVTAAAVIFQLRASPASDLCIRGGPLRAPTGTPGEIRRSAVVLQIAGLCSFTPLGTSCAILPEKCTHRIADQLTLSAVPRMIDTAH